MRDRIPKNYRGIEPTGRSLKKLLPDLLSKMNGSFTGNGAKILAAWPEIIGIKLSKMTSAVSFQNGVLKVKVQNSTLFSLLIEHETARILKKLQDQFPTQKIERIHFFIG